MTTKLAFAGVAAFLLALAQGGCASCQKKGCADGHCASPILPQPETRHVSHKFKPRYAHKTYCPSPCNIKTPFYGFHATCWNAFPAGWQNCPLPCGSGGGVPADELEYAEPVEPLTSGDDRDDARVDQGDGDTSPSDTPMDDDSMLPPPTTGETTDDMPPAENDMPPVMPDDPAVIEADPADLIPADPAPSDLPVDPSTDSPSAPGDDLDGGPSADDSPAPFDPPPTPRTAPAPGPAGTPPTSSRPRPLRAAENRTRTAPQPIFEQSTVKIEIVEEHLSDESDMNESELGLIDVPIIRIGEPPSSSPANEKSASTSGAKRATVTIVEVSATANVEPIEGGDVAPPLPESSKVQAKPAPRPLRPAAPAAPVRHRISDTVDEEVRPVNWIDSFLETTDQ